MSALVEVINVSKSYGRGEAATSVLKDVSLQVQAGEAIAIVGPSGCGKSTLLNLMGGLDEPTSGKIMFDGQDLLTLDQRALARLRNRHVGFIFQLHHLLPQLSVLENVLIPTMVRYDGGPVEQVEKRARALLERVGLSHRLTHRPGQLSGGERQRVAVVRALINQPKLLLADEPTGALDHASAEQLIELLLELNREQGVALVLVTHAREHAARTGRVLELQDGTLMQTQDVS